MLTFWSYRLGVPHQIFQFSLMMAISIDFLFRGHHIPKELNKNKVITLSSYHLIAAGRYMHEQVS